jgi:hypothetical protein
VIADANGDTKKAAVFPTSSDKIQIRNDFFRETTVSLYFFSAKKPR